MEDVHHSQKWNRLCEWLYGPDAGSRPLPDVVEHIQTLVVTMQQMQAQAEAQQEAQPEGDLAAENELLRFQLEEAYARLQEAESYLDTLPEGPQITPDEAMLLLESENQQLREALGHAGQVPTDAPAKHDLNDCGMAILRQLDDGIIDWALEVCRQDNRQPWQLVAGHVALAQERGELASPAVDPSWSSGRSFSTAYTCGGCHKTYEGRPGQLFCSNACAKVAKDRDKPPEPVSDAVFDQQTLGQRQASARTPIRRQGALM